MNIPRYNNGLDQQPSQLTIDDDGIPILNEVVEFDPFEINESDFEGESDPSQAPIRLNLPDQELMMAAVRTQLKSQLQAELAGLIEQATEEAVAQATASLKMRLRTTLSQTLETRLSQLIEEAVDQAL